MNKNINQTVPDISNHIYHNDIKSKSAFKIGNHRVSTAIQRSRNDDINFNINNKYKKKVNKTQQKFYCAFSSGNEHGRNINDFAHLYINNPNCCQGDMYWGIGLRNYINNNKHKNKGNKDNTQNNKLNLPPKFYDEDLDSYYKKKKINPKHKRPLTSKENFNNTRHLLYYKGTDINSLNESYYNYITTLRNNKLYEGVYNNPNKWKVLPYKDWDIPVFKNRTQKHSVDNENKDNKNKCNTFRPYKKVYDSVSIGNDTITRKKYIPNSELIYGKFGEHIALKPYSSNYQDVNIYPNRYLLQNQTNQQCLFELCLRTSGKIIHKKIFRKKKKEMDQIKETNIKSKQEIYKQLHNKYK